MVTFEELRSIAHTAVSNEMVQELVDEINNHLNPIRTEHVCSYVAKMIGMRNRYGNLDHGWYYVDNGQMSNPTLLVHPTHGFKFGKYLEVMASYPNEEEEEVPEPDDYREGCDCNDCREYRAHRDNIRNVTTPN